MRPLTRRLFVVSLAAVPALAVPTVSQAAFGDVDTTFGDLGSALLAGPTGTTPPIGGVSIVPTRSASPWWGALETDAGVFWSTCATVSPAACCRTPCA